MKDRFINLTVMGGILITVFVQLYNLDYPARDLVAEQHAAILDGSAVEPYRFRLLVPVVVDALANVFPIPHAVNVAHAFIGVIGVIWYGVAVFTLYRRLVSPMLALVGYLITMLAVHTTLIFNVVGVHYSWVEAAVMIWGFVWLHTLYTQQAS